MARTSRTALECDSVKQSRKAPTLSEMRQNEGASATHAATRRSARLRGFDPEQLVDVVSDSRLEHFLLASADCDADLLHWECDGLAVDSGRYSFPVRIRGDFTDARFCLGYMRNLSTHTWVNGFEVESDTLQLYPAGSELNYQADAGGQWVAIMIEAEALQAAAIARLGREVELPSVGTLSARFPRSHHEALDRAIARLTGRTLVDSRSLESLLARVAELIVHMQDRTLDSLVRRWRSRQLLLERADAYLRSSLERPFDLSAMAKGIGTSRRSLQRSFAEAYGMTPHQWARCVALHHARKQLRTSDPTRTAIEAVARDCGFRHMGRFAGYYRELFGELPSATLGR